MTNHETLNEAAVRRRRQAAAKQLWRLATPDRTDNPAWTDNEGTSDDDAT